jgi:hypothetical protein
VNVPEILHVGNSPISIFVKNFSAICHMLKDGQTDRAKLIGAVLQILVANLPKNGDREYELQQCNCELATRISVRT